MYHSVDFLVFPNLMFVISHPTIVKFKIVNTPQQKAFAFQLLLPPVFIGASFQISKVAIIFWFQHLVSELEMASTSSIQL